MNSPESAGNVAYNVRGDGACFYRSFGLGLAIANLKIYSDAVRGLNPATFTMMDEEIKQMKEMALNKMSGRNYEFLLGIIRVDYDKELKATCPYVDDMLEALHKMKTLKMEKEKLHEEERGITQTLLSFLQNSSFMDIEHEVQEWIMPCVASVYTVKFHRFVAVSDSGSFPNYDQESKGKVILQAKYMNTYNEYKEDGTTEREGSHEVYLVSSSLTGGHWACLSFKKSPKALTRGQVFEFTYIDEVPRTTFQRECFRCGLPILMISQ